MISYLYVRKENPKYVGDINYYTIGCNHIKTLSI